MGIRGGHAKDSSARVLRTHSRSVGWEDLFNRFNALREGEIALPPRHSTTDHTTAYSGS